MDEVERKRKEVKDLMEVLIKENDGLKEQIERIEKKE